MPEVFVTELRRQRHRAWAQLREARASRDDALADALAARLSELAEIAARNGVSVQ